MSIASSAHVAHVALRGQFDEKGSDKYALASFPNQVALVRKLDIYCRGHKMCAICRPANHFLKLERVLTQPPRVLFRGEGCSAVLVLRLHAEVHDLKAWRPLTYLVTLDGSLIHLPNYGRMNYTLMKTGKDIGVILWWPEDDAQHDNFWFACALECSELGIAVTSAPFMVLAKRPCNFTTYEALLGPHIKQRERALAAQTHALRTRQEALASQNLALHVAQTQESEMREEVRKLCEPMGLPLTVDDDVVKQALAYAYDQARSREALFFTVPHENGPFQCQDVLRHDDT